MNNSKPGKPFQRGDDSRRHLAGRKCKDAIAFSQDFNRALAEGGDPSALAALLWRRALAGHAWAIEILLDRLLGKLSTTTFIPQGPPTVFRIVYADQDMEQARQVEEDRTHRAIEFARKPGENHESGKN